MDGNAIVAPRRGLVERRVPLIAAQSARKSPPAVCEDLPSGRAGPAPRPSALLLGPL